MRSMMRFFVVAAVLVAAEVAIAETCTLELKRLEPQDRTKPFFGGAMDFIYRASSPQFFFMQMRPDGKGGMRTVGNEPQLREFKRIVKKEPKYVCEHHSVAWPNWARKSSLSRWTRYPRSRRPRIQRPRRRQRTIRRRPNR